MEIYGVNIWRVDLLSEGGLHVIVTRQLPTLRQLKATVLC